MKQQVVYLLAKTFVFIVKWGIVVCCLPRLFPVTTIILVCFSLVVCSVSFIASVSNTPNSNPMDSEVIYGATNVFDCSSGDCGNGFTINYNFFIPIGSDDTSENIEITLPQGTHCENATAEGQVCWNTDTDYIYIGDGKNAVKVGSWR